MKNILSTTTTIFMAALCLSSGGLIALGASSAPPLPHDSRPYRTEGAPMSPEVQRIREAHFERHLKEDKGLAFVKLVSDEVKDSENVIRRYEIIIPVDEVFKKGEILEETVYHEEGLFHPDGSAKTIRLKPNSVLFIQASLQKLDANKESRTPEVRYIETINPARYHIDQFEKTWKRIHQENPQLLPAIP